MLMNGISAPRKRTSRATLFLLPSEDVVNGAIDEEQDLTRYQIY